MKKQKKLLINIVAGLVQQIVTVISGLIIPRMILVYYGSATNGLVTSITQFLSLISLCELGVGAVVQSALYKPLAQHDDAQISRVVASANRFFRKVALILLAYVCVLMVAFPYIVNDLNGGFNHIYIAVLLGIIAVNSFSQYYLSIANKLLLNASQLCYVHMLYNTAGLVITTIASAVLMKLGYGIHIVKLAAAVVFLIQPLLINIYVSKKYNIDKKITYTEEPIKQKWNGLAQHFANVVLEHTDTVVLTAFSTLENVSVYAVYHMVINGIRQLVISATSGIRSYLGAIYAKYDESTVNEHFGKIEWCIHTVVALLFAVMGVLILPFVRVYTANVTDADYIAPLFAAVMVAAQGIYCIRLPYAFMIQAAGHYKETQASAIIEAVINVIVSVILVAKFGLAGVAVGTFISMTYRTIYMAWYLSKNIIHRPLKNFVKYIVTDIFTVALMILLAGRFKMSGISYFSWVILAVKVFTVSAVTLLLFNVVFYRKNMKWLLGFAKKK